MKKTIIAALFGALCFSLGAQEIRCNYLSGKISHIATEYEALSFGECNAQGGVLYLLYINLEQKNSVVAPKGVKMAIGLKSGGIIRVEQIGEDSTTKPRLESGLFCNRLKYAIEPADMNKILGGVKSLDVVYGWNPDDYLQASFAGDEFSSLLKRHLEAIHSVEGRTIPLSAELAGYSDNLESILATTKPIVARGQQRIYNVILSYLYYKASNTDDIDLAFQIGTEDSYHIPLDAEVVFVLSDGSTISLPQTRDEFNLVYVYPSMSDVRRLLQGVREIRIPYSAPSEASAEAALPSSPAEASAEAAPVPSTLPSSPASTGDLRTLTDSFLPGEGFAEAVNAQYQTLISVSPK